MYTVMLVDDEQAVLDTLTQTIQWQPLGVNTILTATDGRQALSEMQENKVDLLITDIKMPQMDGLELLRQVRTLYPSVRCILLTAYGEFEYARQSLRLGVENYLLKPFRQEELEKTIEKALDNIYANKQNDTRLFMDNILMRWLTSDISAEELSERAALLDLNIYLKEYCVMVFRKVTRCSLNALGKEIREKAGSAFAIYDFWNNQGQYFMIAGASSLSSTALGDIINAASTALDMNGAFLAAVGIVSTGFENLSRSYQSARELLDTARENSTNVILTPDSGFERYKDSLSHGLDILFHIEDSELRQTGYQQFAQKISAGAAPTDAVLAALSHNLYQLFENQFPGKSEIHAQLQNRIHLSAASASNDFSAIVIELLEYSYLLFQYHFEQLSPVIQNAVSYIHTNYADSLSIKEFCNKNKMNTAYFGFLFKKETGMFFNNYLIQYRISRSLRLLEDTQMQVGEIAEAVGFSSASYFVSSFKKQTGLSPVKYRSMQL